jgi:hypothetical protein
VKAVHGTGVFATTAFKAGDVIISKIAATLCLPGQAEKLSLDPGFPRYSLLPVDCHTLRSLLLPAFPATYVNHTDGTTLPANAEFVEHGQCGMESHTLQATTDISVGSEVLVIYGDNAVADHDFNGDMQTHLSSMKIGAHTPIPPGQLPLPAPASPLNLVVEEDSVDSVHPTHINTHTLRIRIYTL